MLFCVSELGVYGQWMVGYPFVPQRTEIVHINVYIGYDYRVRAVIKFIFNQIYGNGKASQTAMTYRRVTKNLTTAHWINCEMVL